MNFKFYRNNIEIHFLLKQILSRFSKCIFLCLRKKHSSEADTAFYLCFYVFLSEMVPKPTGNINYKKQPTQPVCTFFSSAVLKGYISFRSTRFSHSTLELNKQHYIFLTTELLERKLAALPNKQTNKQQYYCMICTPVYYSLINH